MIDSLVVALQESPATPAYDPAIDIVRTIVALVVVVIALAVFLWLMKRGAFSVGARNPRRTMAVESAIALGDRRSLVIVNVEGRRLLLASTAASVSLITELGQASFGAALEHAGAGPGPGSRT